MNKSFLSFKEYIVPIPSEALPTSANESRCVRFVCCLLSTAALAFPRIAGVWEGGTSHDQRVRQAEGLSSLHSYPVFCSSSHHTSKTTSTACLEPTEAGSPRGASQWAPPAAQCSCSWHSNLPTSSNFSSNKHPSACPLPTLHFPRSSLPLTVLILTLFTHVAVLCSWVLTDTADFWRSFTCQLYFFLPNPARMAENLQTHLLLEHENRRTNEITNEINSAVSLKNYKLWPNEIYSRNAKCFNI